MDQNEQNQLVSKLSEMLRQSMTQAAPAPAPTIAAPGAAWSQPPAFGAQPQFGGGVQPVGLLVAIDIETPQGRVGGYLQLPATALANPQATIVALQQSGFPLRVYGGGSNGGGNNGNSWSGRRSFGRRW